MYLSSFEFNFIKNTCRLKAQTAPQGSLKTLPFVPRSWLPIIWAVSYNVFLCFYIPFLLLKNWILSIVFFHYKHLKLLHFPGFFFFWGRGTLLITYYINFCLNKQIALHFLPWLVHLLVGFPGINNCLVLFLFLFLYVQN